MNRLKGKNAIVTGASSGIGKSIAYALAKEGVIVALIARRLECIEEIKNTIENEGGKAITIQADLTQKDVVSKVVERVQKEIGSVDILINNAARAGMANLAKIPVKTWNKVMQLNLTVPFEFIHLLLPQMRVKFESWIINISSEAATVLSPNSGAYGISKNALNRLTEQVDLENRDYNIHALAICPGWINTKMSMDPEMAGLDTDDILEPEQISEFIVWTMKQPSKFRIGPVISLTPIKGKASFLNGAQTFFEINKDLA